MAKQDMAENQDKGNDKCTIEDLYVGIFKVLFKMTQHIAAKIGVTVTTVSRYELGEREPKLSTIEKIADILGESPSFLAGWGEGSGSK